MVVGLNSEDACASSKSDTLGENIKAYPTLYCDAMKQKSLILCVLFCATFLLIIQMPSGNGEIIPETSSDAQQSANDSVNATLTVLIFSIDASKKSAVIQTNIVLKNFPYNATEIIITLKGRERIQISCTNSTSSYDSYVGNTSIITWYLKGWGEPYPFDVYYLDLSFENTGISWNLGNRSAFIDQNFTFSNASTAIFLGSETESLMGTWQTRQNNEVPIVLFQNEAVVVIARIPWVPYFILLAPILLSFHVLGLSTLIDRRKLSTRLTAYTSLFLFAASFLFALQPLLPYRSALSLPEFLLVTLMMGNLVFTALSIIPVGTEFNGMLLDGVALFVTIILFLISYIVFLFDKINLPASLFIVSIELAAYLLPAIFLVDRLNQYRRNARRMADAWREYVV